MTRDPLKWNPGPPPHVGWWNASTIRKDDVWRWWNGSEWSRHRYSVPFGANDEASKPSGLTSAAIEWRWYWHPHARVPRINPATGEVTGSAPCPI